MRRRAMRSAPDFWRSRSWHAALMLPAATLFCGLAALRRGLYRHGILHREQLPVPVIVVGNIAVGGSGKTPAVLWLIEELRKAGRHPGIVSRGHGGQVSASGTPHLVVAGSDPDFCGDEPVMLARQAGCPVAVGRDRPAAARALLAAHPECDVIVSDDGMQHYRLMRTVEIAVVDESVLGNRWLLPSGPLREPLSRLAGVDLILAHGELSPRLRALAGAVPVASMRLAGERFRSLTNPDEWCGAEAFIGKKVHAIAGIGQPQRFFDQLTSMGLDVIPHPFPDHHRYCAADFDFAPGETKLMTSKDAVKCAAFAPPDAWELPVRAIIDAGAIAPVLEKLNDGRQTA
ncbi:MAG: tetraacyldisaccharide 4'-kinase [Azoarcus sp.]|jgi:tetraacyldisaccharide 4'-kinase|nr:tetraacyldisaccharide 4'-kinase [Azoarcus sp.]